VKFGQLGSKVLTPIGQLFPHAEINTTAVNAKTSFLMNHSLINSSQLPAISPHEGRTVRPTPYKAIKRPVVLTSDEFLKSALGKYSVRQRCQKAALLALIALLALAGCVSPSQPGPPAGPSGEPLTQADCEKAKAWETWLVKPNTKLPGFCKEGEKTDTWCDISQNRVELQKAYMAWRKTRLSSRPLPRAKPVRPKFNNRNQLQNLAALQSASVSAILRGLGRAPRSRLKIITDAALASSACSGPLFLALGSAWENFLPKADFKLIASLYERSAECAQSESEEATNTRFRGGLFYYASGDYERSRNLFAKSAAAPSSTRARSLFWLFRASSNLGNDSDANDAVDKLEKLHPTSFHGLLGTQLANRTSTIRNLDDWFVARSSGPGLLNPLIESTEALQRCSALPGSLVLSNWSIGQLPSPAEPKLLLYLAKLREQAGEHPVKIAISADALSANISLVSRQTLQLFYPRPFWDAFEAQKQVIDPYFLAAVARQESAFDPGAVSSAKAMGLLQLIPSTARRFKLKGNLRSPKANVEVGARYMNFLLKLSEGKVHHSLASYNAGPGKVKLWVTRYQTQDPVLFIDLIPYRETREYVSSVLKNYFWYRTLYSAEADQTSIVAGAFPIDPAAVASLKPFQAAIAEASQPLPKLDLKEKPKVVEKSDPVASPIGDIPDPRTPSPLADKPTSKDGIEINRNAPLPDLDITKDKPSELPSEMAAEENGPPPTDAPTEDEQDTVLPEDISVAPEIDKTLPN
jgi:soluble lytic murein transglycosylase